MPKILLSWHHTQGFEELLFQLTIVLDPLVVSIDAAFNQDGVGGQPKLANFCSNSTKIGSPVDRITYYIAHHCTILLEKIAKGLRALGCLGGPFDFAPTKQAETSFAYTLLFGR